MALNQLKTFELRILIFYFYVQEFLILDLIHLNRLSNSCYLGLLKSCDLLFNLDLLNSVFFRLRLLLLCCNYRYCVVVIRSFLLYFYLFIVKDLFIIFCSLLYNKMVEGKMFLTPLTKIGDAFV